MGMEITGSYGSYANQSMTGNAAENAKRSDVTEKAKTEPASKSTKANSVNDKKAQSNADYMSTLEKLAPSMKFGMDTGLSSAKNGKTLTLNPKLLEKMQRDPKMEKDMKDMIAGVEKAIKISDSVDKSMGMKTVYSHWYIDENGKCWHTAVHTSDDTMSKRLREERNKNSENLIKKRKEKSAELKKQHQKMLEEKKAEKADSEKSEKMSDESRVNLVNIDLKA